MKAPTVESLLAEWQNITTTHNMLSWLKAEVLTPGVEGLWQFRLSAVGHTCTYYVTHDSLLGARFNLARMTWVQMAEDFCMAVCSSASKTLDNLRNL
jgi:hypothetical protein